MTQSDTKTTTITPLRCVTGALVSGSLTLLLYLLTRSIAQTLAAKPVHADSVAILNIAVAVRTLVVGTCALGTGVFGLTTLGLLGLAIQLLIQKFRKQPDLPSDV